MTPIAPHRPSASREIPVRRLPADVTESISTNAHPRDDAEISPEQPWLVPGDPIFSHFLAMLSALFPHGEEFFVDTVRNNRAAIGDNETLRRQVNAFIGQESMHGRAHRTLNGLLAELGYPVVEIDRGVARVCRALLRLPGALPLAVTAAAEHYTGTLAPIFLADKTRDVLLSASDDLAALVQWHALEELEHKNVAFDVLADVNGRYLTRVAGFGFLVATLGVYGAFSWARAVRGDRGRITPEHRRTFRANLRRQDLLSPRTAWETLAYLRPGFHPDDTDTDDLVEHWREVLAARSAERAAV